MQISAEKFMFVSTSITIVRLIGGQTTMKEIIHYNKNPLDRQKIDYKRIFHLSGILENEEFITFSFFQNTAFRVIYNKKKDSFSCFKHTPKFLEENNGTFLSVTMVSGINKTPSEKVPNPIINVNTLHN